MADSKEPQLRTLREGIRPPRDLWPGIERQITARRARLPTWVRVAAAVVILVGLGVWIGQAERPAKLAGTGPEPALAPRIVNGACVSEAQYRRVSTALLSDPAGGLAGLPPESRQRVLASLVTVHSAVQDIETELARDSSNRLLQELLVTTCQDETRVLTEVQVAGSAERAGRGI
jgi:hypothetical protein